MVGIYKITNPKGRIYIGQSINIERRLEKYKKFKDCKKQFKLLNSFNKYDTNNHIFEIIEECEESKLNSRERYWQEHYDSVKNGLNCKLTTTEDKSGKLSEETKLKIGNANRNRKYSPEVLERIRTYRKNYKFSEETKKKMSESAKGRIVSEETRLKISMNSRFNKQVIDITTGVIYRSCSEVSRIFNINVKTLSKKLSGLRPNNTNFKYYVEN